jgi:hypothetical protein
MADTDGKSRVDRAATARRLPCRVQLCYSERAVAPPPSRLRPWCCKVRFRPQ